MPAAGPCGHGVRVVRARARNVLNNSGRYPRPRNSRDAPLWYSVDPGTEAAPPSRGARPFAACGRPSSLSADFVPIRSRRRTDSQSRPLFRLYRTGIPPDTHRLFASLIQAPTDRPRTGGCEHCCSRQPLVFRARCMRAGKGGCLSLFLRAGKGGERWVSEFAF